MQNPEKSDRRIAEDIGVGNKTVSRARKQAGVSSDTPGKTVSHQSDKRIGRDGKAYD
jgi:hypothetical protein